MEGWVKVPGRSKSCWERKYLRLEGSCLCIYEHQPCAGMIPISRLNLTENNGFNVSETVQHPDISGTAKSDIPFIFRIESNSATTCWPSSRLDVMALSQIDKRNWSKALKAITNQNSHAVPKCKKYQTMLRLEKHQVSGNAKMTDKYIIFILQSEINFFFTFPFIIIFLWVCMRTCILYFFIHAASTPFIFSWI